MQTPHTSIYLIHGLTHPTALLALPLLLWYSTTPSSIYCLSFLFFFLSPVLALTGLWNSLKWCYFSTVLSFFLIILVGFIFPERSGCIDSYCRTGTIFLFILPFCHFLYYSSRLVYHFRMLRRIELQDTSLI